MCQGETLKRKVKQKMYSTCIEVCCYAHTCRQATEKKRLKSIMCQIGGNVLLSLWFYGFSTKISSFHLLSVKWKQKMKKKIEKYKPLDCYGQTCIPFGEFTLVRTSHWKSNSNSYWKMKICATRCKQGKVNGSLFLVKKNYM